MAYADSLFPQQFTINCKGRLVDLRHPKVMGILNLTPDSFHADSRVNLDEIVDRAGQMLGLGATFLDLGGYSTRPGAADISVEEETDRVIPAVEAIAKAIPASLISVDTFRSSVAKSAIEAGAVIINDVSAGLLDENMLATVGRFDVPYIMMHMRGTPQTMTDNTIYEDLIPDVLLYFSQRISAARSHGISDIIIDPGFGFSKTVDQNFEILSRLEALQITGLPILAGLSRKSMINKSLNISSQNALNGTSVLNAIALTKGAKILRVHDVKEAVEAVSLFSKLQIS